MKQFVILILAMTLSPAILAESVGHSSGALMYDEDEDTPSVPPAAPVRSLPPPKPVIQKMPTPTVAPESSGQLQPPARPKDILLAPDDVPFQASIAIGSTRCPDPVAHPSARNTPVKVVVDQETQSVQIETPDRAAVETGPVSTGGGLKIPNGEIKKAPYCAETPEKNRIIISAVAPEMFKGTQCTDDEIRAKSTVFPMYHTRTFTDKNGNPVPMPFAIRIAGGIFFHQVPSTYQKLLGHNVSGECVRMTAKMAKFLFAQIKKYGAIEVSIVGKPVVTRGMPQYCDSNMVADAKRRQENPDALITSAPLQVTGTEDIQGGQESAATLFDRIGKFLNQPVARKQVRPEPRT